MSDPIRETVGKLRLAIQDAIDAASRPEYIGEHRCFPCTAVNVVGVALVALLLGRRRRGFGVLAAFVGTVTIWLRGYVVPGTPQFAPRLVSPLPVDFSAKHNNGVDSGSLAGDGIDPEDSVVNPNDPDGIGDSPERDGDSPDPQAVMSALLDAGILVEGGETLRLADSFQSALDERIGALRASDHRELAERAAAVAGEGVTGEVHDGRILLAGRRDAWVSRPVALAETALGELLRDRDVPDAVAREAVRPLRTFLETCPACGGPVRDTTLRKCCGGPGGVSGDPERSVRACADCDAVVFTER